LDCQPGEQELGAKRCHDLDPETPALVLLLRNGSPNEPLAIDSQAWGAWPADSLAWPSAEKLKIASIITRTLRRRKAIPDSFAA